MKYSFHGLRKRKSVTALRTVLLDHNRGNFSQPIFLKSIRAFRELREVKIISIDGKIIVVECLESGKDHCCGCNHYQNCHLVAHDSRGVLITALVSFTLLVSAVVLLGYTLI